MLTLTELCAELSITPATGRNWIKLGKLKPEGKRGRSHLFSEGYVQSLKEDLSSGKVKALRSRRNKSYISGNLLYSSYIAGDSPNLPLVQQIVNTLSAVDDNENSASKDSSEFSINDNLLRCILTKCAEGILQNRVSIDEIAEYTALLYALKGTSEEALSSSEHELLSGLSPTFFDFRYISGEDTLGLVYTSLKHLQTRKSTGAYYTPGTIVQRLLGHLFEASLLTEGQNKKILDPGCGSGNFLLCLPPGIPADNLYGYDTDEISVKIARITLALKYKLPDISFWEEHIVNTNFLHEDKTSGMFDIILGNPPWGSVFSGAEKEFLHDSFVTGKVKSPDSYDLFIEQGINLLNEGGILSYVLPESVLLVKSHTLIRSELLNRSLLSHLEYLGDVFDHVQCPSIILQVKKANEKEAGEGFLSSHPTIYDKDISFRIKSEREVSETGFDFLMPDEEYMLLQKISTLPDSKRLLGNADFALGIVTGNNKEMLKARKSPKNEIILKGSDIFKYAFHIPKCYISFVPEKCQQVAPIAFYRAPKKLLYRFIGGRLIFAYDDKGTLSLNSCNIVIPNIHELDTKYILAILNSSVAEFYFRKKFRSVKILRSHIEQIPIPLANSEIQQNIVSKIDRILKICDTTSESSVSANKNFSEEVETLHKEIDKICFELFKLSEKEIALIKESFHDENLFLPV